MSTSIALPPPDAFFEVPGMRGLRVAHLGAADGKTLEIIEAVEGVVIPHMVTRGNERGRVLQGKIRFHQGDSSRVLQDGDTWELGENAPHGPHIFLAATRLAILRDGPGAFDPQ